MVTIGNLHYPNVRKCPVLSGLLKAIPVITINPLYQHDLQQFFIAHQTGHTGHPQANVPQCPKMSHTPIGTIFSGLGRHNLM